MNSNMTEQLDQLFRMWDRGLCPGAQVLIRQHGKTLYEKCFGYGNLENKLKIHKESIFHVASISKEFTVMSILLLWKERCSILHQKTDFRCRTKRRRSGPSFAVRRGRSRRGLACSPGFLQYH